MAAFNFGALSDPKKVRSSIGPKLLKAQGFGAYNFLALGYSLLANRSNVNNGGYLWSPLFVHDPKAARVNLIAKETIALTSWYF